MVSKNVGGWGYGVGCRMRRCTDTSAFGGLRAISLLRGYGTARGSKHLKSPMHAPGGSRGGKLSPPPFAHASCFSRGRQGNGDCAGAVRGLPPFTPIHICLFFLFKKFVFKLFFLPFFLPLIPILILIEYSTLLPQNQCSGKKGHLAKDFTDLHHFVRAELRVRLPKIRKELEG